MCPQIILKPSGVHSRQYSLVLWVFLQDQSRSDEDGGIAAPKEQGIREPHTLRASGELHVLLLEMTMGTTGLTKWVVRTTCL